MNKEINENLVDIRIVDISSNDELETAFNRGLDSLYGDIFAEPPYCEEFPPDQVRAIFREYKSKGTVLVAYDKIITPVGFGVMMYLRSSSVAELTNQYPDIFTDYDYYMADLGVRSDYRKSGLGGQLIDDRINWVPLQRLMVMRTSTTPNNPSRRLYEARGFEDTGIRQYVPDERMILTKRK